MGVSAVNIEELENHAKDLTYDQAVYYLHIISSNSILGCSFWALMLAEKYPCSKLANTAPGDYHAV